VSSHATLADILPASVPAGALFPVGRLDVWTSGLLLLTNDGARAQASAHPSMGVAKRYLALVAGGRISARESRALASGDFDIGPDDIARGAVLAALCIF
jgi:16S rRNA U516 pseudouridylate synthase RsuA-like enzyme